MRDQPGLRLGTYYRIELLTRLGLACHGGVAVDVGGRDGRWLAGLEAARVLVDVDPVAALPSVCYVKASGDALPLRGRSADTVYSLDVIEHVPDESRLIADAFRLLRPGGRMIMTTPSDDIRVFPRVTNRWIDRKWGHDRVRGFDAAYLETVVRKAGAGDVQVHRLAMRAFRLSYLPVRALWSVDGRAGRAVTRLLARIDARVPWGRRGALLVIARSGS
ncbi:MAG: methyltransferase domain-containing protein [Actinobacteria bacterium]|nr:methyltransferase domain-containing protein [Actinomycetota bacterium]